MGTNYLHCVTVSLYGIDIDAYYLLQHCDFIAIHIPIFCNHNYLHIAGNCRICVVELSNKAKPVISCATELFVNMDVYTSNIFVTDIHKSYADNIIYSLFYNSINTVYLWNNNVIPFRISTLLQFVYINLCSSGIAYSIVSSISNCPQKKSVVQVLQQSPCSLFFRTTNIRFNRAVMDDDGNHSRPRIYNHVYRCIVASCISCVFSIIFLIWICILLYVAVVLAARYNYVFLHYSTNVEDFDSLFQISKFSNTYNYRLDMYFLTKVESLRFYEWRLSSGMRLYLQIDGTMFHLDFLHWQVRFTHFLILLIFSSLIGMLQEYNVNRLYIYMILLVLILIFFYVLLL